jgi:serine/threonine-protein kinase RsbW
MMAILGREGGTLSAGLGTARTLAETDFPLPEVGPPPSSPAPAGRGPSPAAHPAPAPVGQPRTVAAACRAFTAQPLQVAHARRFVAGVLTGASAADDIVLCVSELASNAVLHSSSRAPGGHFVIRAWITAGGRIRAEVEDCGGPWVPGAEEDEERGRGLLIVARLATRWGITGGDRGRIAWLELDPA